MNLRKTNGVTLVALIITVILLLIISGISITGTLRGHKETKEASQISELNMIQHAILERYTKAQLTKEELPGTLIAKTEVEEIINDINAKSGKNITLKGTEYKRLDVSDLKNLGIKKEEDSFIVNYKTGEVINETIKVTKSGSALYVYSKNEELKEKIIVKNGLLLYYDAINNTGNGHSSTTDIWKDLSGNENDGKLYDFTYSTDSEWKENCLSFNGTNNSVLVKNVLNNLEEMTIEIVYASKIAKNWQYYWGIKSSIFGLESNSEDLRRIYYGEKNYVNFNGLASDTEKVVSNTIVFNKNNIQAYKNGTNIATYEINNLNTEGEYFGIGSDGQRKYCTKMDCYTFRIYNRSLNRAEIENNYEVDKEKFEI